MLDYFAERVFAILTFVDNGSANCNLLLPDVRYMFVGGYCMGSRPRAIDAGTAGGGLWCFLGMDACEGARGVGGVVEGLM
jgi:hypothetical protein